MPQTLRFENPVTGESFDAEFPDDLWLDMQAFAEVKGWSLQELVNHALENFFKSRRTDQEARY